MGKQFKVLEGSHFESGRTYNKGQIVTSDQPLDRLFQNKFQALDGGGDYTGDVPEQKVVIDGGRSGTSSGPVDQSATVAEKGGHSAWADAENNIGSTGKGTDVRGPGAEQQPVNPDEQGGEGEEGERAPTRASTQGGRRATSSRR